MSVSKNLSEATLMVVVAEARWIVLAAYIYDHVQVLYARTGGHA